MAFLDIDESRRDQALLEAATGRGGLSAALFALPTSPTSSALGMGPSKTRAREAIGLIACTGQQCRQRHARHALADIDACDLRTQHGSEPAPPGLRHPAPWCRTCNVNWAVASIICLSSTGWMKKNAGYPLYATMAKAATSSASFNGMARELGQQRHPHQWAGAGLGDHREAAKRCGWMTRASRAEIAKRAVPARAF